jgi:hypothetical protein
MLGFGRTLLHIAVTGPGFLPTDLSNLALWLRADLGIIVSGGNVTQWTDQSGSSYVFTNAGSINAPYVSSGLNSLPSLGSSSVSNSGYFLQTSTLASTIMNGSACERFMVMQAQSPQPYGLFSSTFGASGSSTFLPYADGNSYDDFFSNIRKTISGQNLSTPSIYDTQSSAGNWTSLVNGTQTFTTSSNTSEAPSSPLNLLGNAGNWSGLLSEVIVYNRILSPTENTQVTNYLSSRYNISI